MATPGAWLPPPKSLTLPENQLHIWRARLACDGGLLRRFEKILSEEERKRAEKFLVTDAKVCFVAARGILRETLGKYTGVDPAEIVLGYGPYGKPFVSAPDTSRAVRFNLSHSHGYAAFVFARGREAGIDIEQIRQEAAGEDIARRFFSQQEVEQLCAMPEEIRTEGFFSCWTRKEAYIKALGQGLQIPLHGFSVSITEVCPQELMGREGSRWSLYQFEPAPGFAGAVAAQGKGWQREFWEWQA
jgi:4'-phosphopantetheinyl transferase